MFYLCLFHRQSLFSYAFLAVIFTPRRGDADLLDFASYFNNRTKKPPLSRRTTKVAYSGGSRASSFATAPAIDRYTFSIGGGVTPAAGGRISVFSHGRTMQAPVFCRMLTSPLLYHTFLLCGDIRLQFRQTAVYPVFAESPIKQVFPHLFAKLAGNRQI